ncbi:MAG: four-carbon acid sugar kinase family protein, partial [Candidatus Binatia bacterium]
IDTGLRGSLGAELDAAMDAVGATEAFVLPAIPEVGRTTRGGVQRIDGVPVDATAFAADPDNPVSDARVAAVIEATSRRRAGVVDLTEIRRGTVASMVDRLRAAGVAAIVCDAETEQDLDRTVRILLARARPLVLAGSTGLARALRRTLGTLPPNAPRHDRDWTTATRGVLCVVGSLHPVARDQLAAAEALSSVRVLVVATDAEVRPRGEEAASCIAAGVHVALVTPSVHACPEGLRLLGEAVRHSLGGGAPAGLVLVGGETAFGVLVSIGVRWLVVEGAPAPLAVRAHVPSGPLAGMPVMTKGGSTGSPERLAELLREVAA